MLEVVFSDSAKGAIKAAKNYSKGSMPGEAAGESFKDVVCIGFNLDVGDIACKIDGEERRRTFVELFGSVDFEKEELENFFNAQRDDLEKLISAAKDGRPIRVWKSNAPFSACAYAFLCNVLLNIDCKISAVTMPEYWETSDNTISSCTDWAELTPGQYFRFLSLERDIPAMEKRLQSSLWNDLKTENAPLRALVNGKLISVPEDFYDHIIVKNIPGGEFIMARLIGNILGRYSLGVGDGWYALRIKKMIDENKLEVIANKNPDHPYGRILRLRPKNK